MSDAAEKLTKNVQGLVAFTDLGDEIVKAKCTVHVLPLGELERLRQQVARLEGERAEIEAEAISTTKDMDEIVDAIRAILAKGQR